MKYIGIAGAQSSTIHLMDALIRKGYIIHYLINPGPEKAHMIADYQDLQGYSEKYDIKLVRPSNYTMKDDKTRLLFDGIIIDILIVIGWQRLIPVWLLKKLSIGAFGMHGSSEPLPKGRGRSPMNWSIIEQKEKFITNLFNYYGEHLV